MNVVQAQQTKGHHAGFSLIELIIVLAIASILASVAVPNYNRYVQQSTVSKALVIMQKAKTEINEQFALTGNLPASSTVFHNDTSDDADFSSIYFHNSSSFTHIVAQFGPGAGSLHSKRLWLSAGTSNPNCLRWTCTNYAYADKKIPEEALPSECQN